MTQTQMQAGGDPSRNRLERWLIVVAAPVLALACFGVDLSYGLTDLDTMMNIAAARVQSFSDLESVLFGKLTGGRAGLDANFYRPTLMALFAGVRGLFGWAPAAYHAVNISLHALCTVLVVAFTRTAARRFGHRRPRAVSLWAGLVFALHPITVDVVPAIARAGDLLVTVFLLGSLLATDRYVETCQLESRPTNRAAIKRASIFGVWFALALTSKEPGIVVFAASLLYAVLARDDVPTTRRVTELAVLFVPAFSVALLFFVVRAGVLGETLGGYHLENSTWSMVVLVANFLPADLLAPTYSGAVEVGLPFFLRLSLFSSGTLGYLVCGGTLLALGLWGALQWTSRRASQADKRTRGDLARIPSLQMALFALGVIGAFAALFVVTAAYDRRLLYPVLPFFSLLPALLFDAAYNEVELQVRGRDSATPLVRRVGLVAIATVALFTLLVQSPLVLRDREWKEAGRATQLLTETLREQWEQLPTGSSIWVVNLPGGFDFDARRRIQYSERSSTNALNSTGLQAWLDDRWPDRALRVNALGNYRYREPLLEFRHEAGVRDGWLEFNEPRARADVDYVYAARLGFRLRDLGGGRLALARLEAPRPKHEFLLVVDGVAPVFVPTARLDVVP